MYKVSVNKTVKFKMKILNSWWENNGKL